jgi:hypothetical protein
LKTPENDDADWHQGKIDDEYCYRAQKNRIGFDQTAKMPYESLAFMRTSLNQKMAEERGLGEYRTFFSAFIPFEFHFLSTIRQLIGRQGSGFNRWICPKPGARLSPC